MRSLEGTVALVAGGTRGAGRGIAVMLGEAGATVYVTGRSVRGSLSPMGRPETIEETAEMVTARGGRGIPVRVDHTDEAQVEDLIRRVGAEQDGRLDLLVNDVWGGDPLAEWSKPFWEHDLQAGLQMQRQAVTSHIITARAAAPLMVARRTGLIIEVTDGDDYRYRGSLFYSLAKISAIHLATAMAADLKPHGVVALALTPGYLRSEAVLENWGVTEANWREGAQRDPHFIASETPYYIGKAVVALASDPNVAAKAGQCLSTWGLSDEYGLVDVDGGRPHWGRHYAEHVARNA